MMRSMPAVRIFGAALLSLVTCVTFASLAHSLAVDSQKAIKSGSTTKIRMEVEVPRVGNSESALDILFVVDDSGSMSEHQAKLLANIGDLVRAAKDSGVSLHAGVINTNVDSQPWSSKPGVTWKGELSGEKKKFASTDDGDFTNVLTDNLKIAMNTEGSGTEQPFEAVRLALSEPLLSGANNGFLRPGAGLAVFVLTDADDQSKMPVPEFVTFLKSLKTKSTVSLHAAYMPSADPKADRGSEPLPVRLEQALSAFGTLDESVSLTDPAFASKLKSIGDGYEIVGLRVVPLKAPPVVSSMKVTYGTVNLTGGDMEFGWTYNPKKLELLLGDQIEWESQPVGTPLVIEYVAK